MGMKETINGISYGCNVIWISRVYWGDRWNIIGDSWENRPCMGSYGYNMDIMGKHDDRVGYHENIMGKSWECNGEIMGM
jgi:hypothetical protein